MAGDLTIEVKTRSQHGKNANRRLRAQGAVPAVVYGMMRDAVPIQVERQDVMTLLKAGTGENTVFLLRMAGSDEQRHTMIREMQVDAIDHQILHIDFQRIDLKEVVRVKVPIEIFGTPEGVKTDGGLLDFVTRELEVECLPTSIPASLALDVSEMRIGDHLEAGVIELPAGVTLIDEPDRVLAAVSMPKAVEEEEVVEDEDLLEGESDEPQVIGRGKEDGEEGDSEGE
jgi:large subunit ribosomal protein L25